MNALIAIIGQLVTATPPSVWRALRYFPFIHILEPKGRLFDVLILHQNAQGAVGIIWIAFENSDKLLCFPFRLSRYLQDADIYTLSPWSYHDATTDPEFYIRLQDSFQNQKTLVTYRNSFVTQKIFSGLPTAVALGISGAEEHSFVRVESQKTYKFYRILTIPIQTQVEVEVLRYLTEESTFKHFPQLTEVIEYSVEAGKKTQVLLGMQYLQSNGSLWNLLLSALETNHLAEIKSAQLTQSQHTIEQLLQQSARLLGSFHRAMALAKGSSMIVPEHNHQNAKKEWLESLKKYTSDLFYRLQFFTENVAGLEDLCGNLQLQVEQIFENLKHESDLGILIRAHGNLHLGHIFVNRQNQFLTGFFSDTPSNIHFLNQKHSCYLDISSYLLSLRFAWYLARGKTTKEVKTPLDATEGRNTIKFNQYLSCHLDFENILESQEKELTSLESMFLRIYYNVIQEDLAGAALVPHSTHNRELLLNLSEVIRMLAELLRDLVDDNPRSGLTFWLLRRFWKRSSE